MTTESSSKPISTTTTLEEEMRLSEARQKEIDDEIKQSPLTAAPQPLSVLRSNYSDAPNFLAGLKPLETKYQQIRTVRGDGNCYYRAFLYRLAETLLQQPENATNNNTTTTSQESQRILEFCKTTSWKLVQAAGYEPMTIEVFYEELVELMEKLVDGTMDAAALQTALNEENATSDYCTWYLRVITATHLKSDPDRFVPFLDGFLDIPEFCKQHVEPMGKECEQVQVLALAEAFGVQVEIEYLDGHDLVNGKLANHVFGPETAKTRLVFLYRPGHYDILYPKE